MQETRDRRKGRAVVALLVAAFFAASFGPELWQMIGVHGRGVVLGAWAGLGVIAAVAGASIIALVAAHWKELG